MIVKMKAHMRKASQQPRETALLFCLEAEKGERARQALENFGAKTVLAGPADAVQTLGALLCMDGFPRHEYEGDPDQDPGQKSWEEAIVFSGFENSRLNAVLSRLRSAGASVDYKAVLTVNNQGWTMAHLMGELAREHSIFSKLDQMRSLMRQLLSRDPKKLSEQDRKEAAEAIARASAIMKKPSASQEDEMDMAIAALQRSIAMAMAADITGSAGAAAEPAQGSEEPEQE